MAKILAAFLVFFSLSASAEDYHWPYNGVKYSSLDQVCVAYGPPVYGTGTVLDTVIYSDSGASGRCQFKHPSSPSWSATSGYFYRAGSGCTLPRVIDANGSCYLPPSCPFGQIFLNGVCSPIPCPAGTSYQRDTLNTALEIYRCLDNCPSNTVTNMDPNTHIQVCGIADINTPEVSDSSTCPSTKVQIGFDGAGKAICMNSAGKDPCPSGTHNISSDPANPNCTANSPAPPSTVSESKAPTETKTNADGSVEKTDVKETTFPDGSKQTVTTKTTTGTDGGTKTDVTTQCSREGACGGSSGGGGGGSGTGNGTGEGDGDEKVDNPVQQQGDLYAKKEKTFSQVLTSFNNTVKASPFIAAANSYFTVSVGGGACPSWKATVPYLNMVVDTGQFFCTSLMSSVFGIIAAGLMLGASYIAFRWAFL